MWMNLGSGVKEEVEMKPMTKSLFSSAILTVAAEKKENNNL